MKFVFSILLIFLMAGCGPVSNPSKNQAPGVKTNTPPTAPAQSTPTEVFCGFVEGRMSLDDISNELVGKLKNAGLPIETANAQAYGENCIAEDGSFVRFSAKETDFYVTLNVKDLTDEVALGELVAKTLDVIDLFPIEKTPGPKPGYVGITFKAGTDILNLWFTQTKAQELRNQKMHGAELYQGLKNNP